MSNASFDRMPTKAVDEAKRCLIDGFGVVLAGATVHGSGIVNVSGRTFLETFLIGFEVECKGTEALATVG